MAGPSKRRGARENFPPLDEPEKLYAPLIFKWCMIVETRQ